VAYQSSNESLYQILADCLRLYYFVAEPRDQKPRERRDELKTHLEKILDARNASFTSDTPLATVIVRCVFKTDRKRASVYSIVLRLAILEAVKPCDLASFIRAAGGVEELRLRKGKGSKASAQRNGFDVVWAVPPVATLPAGSIATDPSANDTIQVAVMVVRKDGSADVKWIGDNKSALRLAVNQMAKSVEPATTVTEQAA
jgi:hypothetical protein